MNQRPQQNDPRETYATQAVEGIKALSPADKSWIAGFVIIFTMLVGTNAWVQTHTIRSEVQRAADIRAYFEVIEINRAEEIRRTQETVRLLADSLSRDTERSSQTAAALFDQQGRLLSSPQVITLSPDFIGPPEGPQ